MTNTTEAALRDALAEIKQHARPRTIVWKIAMEPGDEFCDLFPGSGAVTEAYRSWLDAKNGTVQFGMFGEAA